MASKTNNPASGEKYLVFAVTVNPVLGFLIESFAVGKTRNDQFEYGFKKLHLNTYHDYFKEVTPEQKELLGILNQVSDQNLQKRFDRKKQPIRQFYENLEQRMVDDHVRPFIDKILYKAVSYMAEQGIPLYYKGEPAERIRETPLDQQNAFAETCFYFEKLAEKTHYRLLLQYQGKELSLYNQNVSMVLQKPCLLLLNNTILRFEPDWDGKKLTPFFNKEFLEVPASAEKQFYEKFVRKAIASHPFKVKGFEVKVVDSTPGCLLKMEEHWQGHIVFGLYFMYGKDVQFPCHDTSRCKVFFRGISDPIVFEKYIRNQEFEKDIQFFLKKLGLQKVDGPYFSLRLTQDNAYDAVLPDIQSQVHDSIDWVNQHQTQLDGSNIKVEKNVMDKNYFTGNYQLSFQTRQVNDWFDLYGVVRFDDVEVPFVRLVDNILQGIREFELPDGRIALIPTEWFSKYQDLVKFGQKGDGKLKVKKYHYPLLKEVKEDGLRVPGFQEMDVKTDVSIPGNLKASLRSYQVEGFNWLMFLQENNLGGCLADDMGLGKTLQTLALLLKAHRVTTDAHDHQPVNFTNQQGQLTLFDQLAETRSPDSRNSDLPCSLIIMPLSLIHNWQQEIRKFAPELSVMPYLGGQRASRIPEFDHFDVVLTTYGTVRNDIELLGKHQFYYIILDESQVIKNPRSKIFSAIRKLQSHHRFVLTGTPVENSLTDLWSQFSFINPGMLGSLKFFNNEFVLPIEKKSDDLVAQKLQKLIQPFILRRTKGEVAKELPPLSEKVHYCEMTPEQESYYESKKSEIRNTILENLDNKGVEKSKFILLSGLTRLRLIANHPCLIDNNYAFESGKYTEVIRSVENLLAENHKVLIFSQFVKHLNLFGDVFAQQQIKHSMLTGKVHQKDRNAVIESFQGDPQNQLFLISLRAGGVGLNLTKADYVLVLDPWWNPAVENQAINRAHRIGQEQNVFVYKYITRNTVEEKILKLQQRREKLAGTFINNNNPLKLLSFEELQQLI